MSRENLIALHSAFREASKWPAPVRETVVRWLANTVQPNGRERHSPVAATIATASQPTEEWPEVWKPRSKQRRPPKPRPDPRPHRPDKVRILELQLLQEMRDRPGASMAQLATIAGVAKSRTLWRLHALAERGAIEKDADGHWRLVEEEVDGRS
jgi:Winged helix-turn-helix DNA-binding